MNEEQIPDEDEDGSDWHGYVTQFEELAAGVFVDMNAAQSDEISNFPVLCIIRIPLLSADENGMPSIDEAEEVFDIDYSIIEMLTENHVGMYVGRVTVGGNRDFFIYCADGSKIESLCKELLEKDGKYVPEFTTQDDPDWDLYFRILYPSPMEIIQIQNNEMVEDLLESGDSLTTPRPVEHLAFFASEEGRNGFEERLNGKNYAVISKHKNQDAEDEMPFGVHFQKETSVDWEIISELTYELADLASEFGGEYEGWDCEAITESN